MALWELGDHRQLWLRNFAPSVSFSGSEEFVERIVAYSFMEHVSLNRGTRAFHKNSQPAPSPSSANPAILKLLEH